jgi:hypothetical protein
MDMAVLAGGKKGSCAVYLSRNLAFQDLAAILPARIAMFQMFEVSSQLLERDLQVPTQGIQGDD